ncbi:MAG: CHRD domain-containing protein [Alphaproteobacteria bacterium]|nr:CHRD domain-containing protein [Alphaproteobacteria bacterium]
MKRYWVALVFFSSVLAVGCGETATGPEANGASPAGAPVEAAETLAEAHALRAVLAPGEGVDSTANGAAAILFTPSTGLLEYTVTYSGLSGPAVAAHIHGPADPGADAPPVITFSDAAHPISGTATLTEAQAADLLAGRYYVNVHTAANPGGEIRGHIVSAQ